MTRFIQPDFPLQHAGATRVTRLLNRARHAMRWLGSAAGMASLLVTAGLSALIVVVDQIVSAWADGHLLAAWIALWLIVFGLLAVFSDAIRAWPLRLQAHILARRKVAAQRAEDRRTWAAALADPRLMAELDCAFLHAPLEAEATGQVMPQWPSAGANKYAKRQASGRTGTDDAGFQPAPSHDVNAMPSRQNQPNRGFRSAPFPGMPNHLQYLSD